jgi:uncharacterized protein YlaN (UPF0358 family)
MNTIVIDITPSVKTKAENETAFAHLQTLATQRMAEFEADYGFPTSLTYEEVLATLMAVYTREGGYDFTGMVARNDFNEWVDQMESEFGDMSDAQIAQRTGIPMS